MALTTKNAAPPSLWRRLTNALSWRVIAWRGVLHSLIIRSVLTLICQPKRLSSQRTMVFAPHPDDETFGCGGLIAAKRRQGVDVCVVFLTDGRSSHHSLAGGQPTPETLVSLRHQEALQALEILGVEVSAAHFLDYPDGELSQLSSQAYEQVLTNILQLLSRFAPAEVYIPHAQDFHADHEMTHRIVLDALGRWQGKPEVWQYPIWVLWYRVWGIDLNRDALRRGKCFNAAAVLSQKHQAIQAYQSQFDVLSKPFLAACRSPQEFFFKLEI